MKATSLDGVTRDLGPRQRTTLDVAFDDATSGLHRLDFLDEGDRLRRIPPADAEDQIRELYAAKRKELTTFGADLNSSDFYRAPRSVPEEAAG